MSFSHLFKILRQMRPPDSENPNERVQAVLHYQTQTDLDRQMRRAAEQVTQRVSLNLPAQNLFDRDWMRAMYIAGQPDGQEHGAVTSKLRWRFRDVPFLYEPKHKDFLLGRSDRVGSLSYGLALAVLLVLLGIAACVFISFAIPNWQAAGARERDGITTTGTIVDRWISESDKSEYVPHDLANSELAKDTTAAAKRRMAWTMAVVCIAVPALFIIIAIAMRKRACRVVQKGQVLRGVVVSYRRHDNFDSDLNVSLRYKFVTPGGKTIVQHKRSSANQLKDVCTPLPGTAVAVLYMNDKTYWLL